MVLSNKHTRETNWKQKFDKLQNENISLTNLNVENNGNFPILAFGDYFVNAHMGDKKGLLSIVKPQVVLRIVKVNTDRNVNCLCSILLKFKENNGLSVAFF